MTKANRRSSRSAPRNTASIFGLLAVLVGLARSTDRAMIEGGTAPIRDIPALSPEGEDHG
jgi:hypothetical protein